MADTTDSLAVAAEIPPRICESYRCKNPILPGTEFCDKHVTICETEGCGNCATIGDFCPLHFWEECKLDTIFCALCGKECGLTPDAADILALCFACSKAEPPTALCVTFPTPSKRYPEKTLCFRQTNQ